MNLLALDTCDARGSISVLRDDQILNTVEHDTSDDYSIWLLPAIDRALQASGLMAAVTGMRSRVFENAELSRR